MTGCWKSPHVGDGNVQIEAAFVFKESRILHVADLGDLFILDGALLADHLSMLLNAVMDVLLDLTDELLSGVAKGENMGHFKQFISYGLVDHVTVSRVMELWVEDFLIILEGLLDSHDSIRKATTNEVMVMIMGRADGLTILPAFEFLNDHFIGILFIFVLEFRFVRLGRAAFIPIVDVSSPTDNCLVDAFFFHRESDLDFRVVVS